MNAKEAREVVEKSKGKQSKKEYRDLIKRIKVASKYGFGRVYCPILYPENVEKLKSLGYEVAYDKKNAMHSHLGHLIEWSKEK